MDENNVEQKDTKKKMDMNSYMKILLVIAMVAVVGFMILRRNSSDEESCTVITQSPFGQSQEQIWVDLESKAQNKGIAGFDLEVPAELEETYTNVSYRVFSYQINEVTFNDDDGEKVIRIDKAKYCGNDILDTDDDLYSVISKINVDGKEVKIRGDGEKYTAISWVDGEFSYGITAYKGGITQDVIEKYVSEIE